MKKNVFMAFAMTGILLTACGKKQDEAQSTENQATEQTNVEAKNEQLSLVNWKVDDHFGTIGVKNEEVVVEDGKIKSGVFTIDISTINVEDLKDNAKKKADLEAHLKGDVEEAEKADHFFNIKKYPTGKFTIKEVKEVDGKQLVTGELELKGKTEVVEFPAVVTVSENDITIKSETFKINRTKWGINYNSKSIFSDLKDHIISDDIEVSVDVKADIKK